MYPDFFLPLGFGQVLLQDQKKKPNTVVVLGYSIVQIFFLRTLYQICFVLFVFQKY